MSQFVQLEYVGVFFVVCDAILEMIVDDPTTWDNVVEPIDLTDLLDNLDDIPMCELPLGLNCLLSLTSPSIVPSQSGIYTPIPRLRPIVDPTLVEARNREERQR